MSTLIVCISREHGNTQRVADAIAGELGATIATPDDVDVGTVADHDLIGFGTGVRFGRPYPELLGLIDRLPQQSGTRCFVFSTSGFGWLWWHSGLKKRLTAKGFVVADEFCCKGLDTMGLLGLLGGVNKGRPNGTDIADARSFAGKLKS